MPMPIWIRMKRKRFSTLEHREPHEVDGGEEADEVVLFRALCEEGLGDNPSRTSKEELNKEPLRDLIQKAPIIFSAG